MPAWKRLSDGARTFAAAALLAWGVLGCVGTPSPLAPGVRGSVGVPHHGCLTDGVALPKKGPGFERLRKKDDVKWGNPRLVEAIRLAAAEVAKARPGGAPLFVADLSKRRGGQADGHRSHRTGRDADLLLYTLTPDGRSIRSPGFVKYGPDGLAENDGTFFRLDVERSWLLVKALLQAPGADVQWLFVARWLEALLIEHARARGESDELVHRAESVLLQPGDSSPHADHFHLRIACSSDELVRGCLGGGPRWRWLSPTPQLGPLRDGETIAAIIGDLLPGDVRRSITGEPATPPLTSDLGSSGVGDLGLSLRRALVREIGPLLAGPADAAPTDAEAAIR